MEYSKSVYLNTDLQMDRVDMKYLEGHAGRFYDDLQLKYAHNKYKICAFYIANVAPGPESEIVVVVAIPAQTQTSIRSFTFRLRRIFDSHTFSISIRLWAERFSVVIVNRKTYVVLIVVIFSFLCYGLFIKWS